MVGTKTAITVLVVGGGSIARRHIGNLAAANDVSDIQVFTRNRTCLEAVDHRGKARYIDSLDDAKADLALIANETNKHIETAISLAGSGFHIMIEKPVSHSLARLDVLKTTAARTNIKIFIAYNLRFLGVMTLLKKHLVDGTIGSLCFAHIEVGQYLPTWRPGTDYRKSYSADKSRGGGVALDLSHEIDYMRYLFGDPESSTVIKVKAGDLEIDSDDLFEGLYRFNDNFVCTVHLDYLQRAKTRTIKIVGTRGELVCDLMNKTLRVVTDKDDTTITDAHLFDVPKTYQDELRHVISAIRNDQPVSITLDDGIAALRLIEDTHV